jgi:hypothetical protein
VQEAISPAASRRLNIENAHVHPAGAQDIERLRKLRIAFAAVLLVGAVILTFASGRPLFFPGPPMLPRAGRVVTILLLSATHFTLLAAAALPLFLPRQWSTAGKMAFGGVVASAAAIALAFAPTFDFWLVHLLCYSLQGCGISQVPEQVIYTLNVATREALWTPLAALASVLCAAGVLRRAHAKSGSA